MLNLAWHESLVQTLRLMCSILRGCAIGTISYFLFHCIPEMEVRKTCQKRCRPSSSNDEVKLNSDYDISSTLMLISHPTGSKEKTKSLVVRRSQSVARLGGGLRRGAHEYGGDAAAHCGEHSTGNQLQRWFRHDGPDGGPGEREVRGGGDLALTAKRI